MDAKPQASQRKQLASRTWPERTFLGAMAPTTREELLSLGLLHEFRADDILIHEGVHSDVMILLDGWVKVVARTPGGRSALLALRTEGDLIGEIAALEDRPSSATVISVGVTLVQMVKQRDFLQFLARSPDAALAVSRGIAAQFRWADRRRTEFSGLPVRARLSRILSDLAQINGKPTEQGMELGFTLSQPELASLVGISEPSLQKALRQLRSAGILMTGYRKIVIREPRALELVAAGLPLREYAATSVSGHESSFEIGTTTTRGGRITEVPDEISVNVYLDSEDESTIARVIQRVDDFVAAMGYEGPVNPVSNRGSFIRKSWAKIKVTLTSDEVRELVTKAEHAIELRYLDDSQAGVDGKVAEAISSLLASLGDVPSACIRAGSILLVKYTDANGSVVLSKNLSMREVKTLERYPEIQQQPHKVLEALALAQSHFDTDPGN